MVPLAQVQTTMDISSYSRQAHNIETTTISITDKRVEEAVILCISNNIAMVHLEEILQLVI